MSKLEHLKTAILADGRIDSKEVEQLREVLFADGVIDRDEAEFLFSLSDGCPDGNDASWPTFFADAIIRHVMDDAGSPQLVDADEAAWLREKIMGDGKVCDAERQLMRQLKAVAKNLPADLLAFINAHT